jgi:hypothetical protein
LSLSVLVGVKPATLCENTSFFARDAGGSFRVRARPVWAIARVPQSAR